MDDGLRTINTIKQFESLAVDLLDQQAKYYFCAGANTNSIPRDNEEAFRKYRIQPRVLRDVSKADLSCDILSSEVSCPIGIAPTGFHFFAHKDGEIATALGSAKEGCIYIMSSVSSTSIENVSSCSKNVSPKATIWMQIYMFKDRSVTLDIIRRAEKNGFSAIVVTVDAPISGQWKTNLPEGFAGRTQNKYLNLPNPCSSLQDATVTFDDLKWLKQQTKLPIIAKGILCGEDAKKAALCGVDAIYVSNHGGRQIHKVVSTGEEGVRRILQILKNQLLSTMKLAGVKSVKDINKSMV